MAKSRTRARGKAKHAKPKRLRAKALGARASGAKAMASPRGEIIRVAQLPSYTPPGHSGTTNVRLVDGRFNGRFELVLGKLEPGGVADRHSHAREAQVVYVRAGQARITLGVDPPQLCGPETVIRIPPGVDHEVVSLGPETLELIIVYSPPLNQTRSQPAASVFREAKSPDQSRLLAGERASARSGDSRQRAHRTR
jgi:quercetin dioxygenase-like cupin family protein